MIGITRAIQGLILFSTVLGILFLWQAYPLLPPEAFDFVGAGWVLFVVDSALTFIRPKESYYLGLALGVLALGATLSQPEHFALIASGNVLATVTIVVGSISQALLIGFVAYYLISKRVEDPWAWPGAKAQV